MKKLKTILQSKILLAVLLVLTGFFVYTEFEHRRDTNLVQAEIDRLNSESEALDNRSRELKESLSFLHSAGGKERLAKQEMNMKKNGEVVVNFTSGGGTKEESSTPGTSPEKSNMQKWWEYFFSKREKKYAQ